MLRTCRCNAHAKPEHSRAALVRYSSTELIPCRPPLVSPGDHWIIHIQGFPRQKAHASEKYSLGLVQIHPLVCLGGSGASETHSHNPNPALALVSRRENFTSSTPRQESQETLRRFGGGDRVGVIDSRYLFLQSLQAGIISATTSGVMFAVGRRGTQVSSPSTSRENSESASSIRRRCPLSLAHQCRKLAGIRNHRGSSL